MHADDPAIPVGASGALIPLSALQNAGIKPGDHVTVLRTTRGALLVLPTTPTAAPSALSSVIGIAPRPSGVSPADDQAFLHDVRYGDETRQTL
jgi:hypothetical protein